MKHPLLLAGLCATGAVAVLSGVAIAAFATPATTQASTLREVAPLIVPLDHHPAAFAPSPMAAAAGDGELIVVTVPGARPVEDASETVHSPAQPGTASSTHSQIGAHPDSGDPSSSSSAKPDGPVVPSAGPGMAPSSETGEGKSAGPEKAAEAPKPGKVEKAPKPPKGETVTGPGRSAHGDGVSTHSKPAKPGT